MQLTSRRVSIKCAITVTLSSSRDSKKGREEGHLESLSESIANLVRSGHFSIEAALDILKVSADIRSTVKENAEKALSK